VVTPGRTTGLRERKKAQTRDAIIEAALDLFERKGYDETTVEEIAAAADVSERTFFRYFDSKMDVVMADKHRDQTLEEVIDQRPAHESPIEAFRNAIRDELGPALQADDIRVRQFRVTMSTPSLRSAAHEHFNEHHDEIANVFARRLDVPIDALAPQVMATAVAGVMWTVVDRWVAEGKGPERLLELLDEAFDLLGPGFS
jgi:AcrR family transcriptional regulator